MGKSKHISSPLKSYIVFLCLAFILGFSASTIVHMVFAQQANNVLHACAQKATGNLRLLLGSTGKDSANSTTQCNKDEVAVDWNIQGVKGDPGTPGDGGSGISGLGLVWGTCNLNLITSEMAGHDFSNAILDGCNLTNGSVQGVILNNANLDLTYILNSDMSNASFTHASLHDTTFSSTNLSNANFTNANVSQANFTSTNLTNANFTDATGMDTATFDNVIWSHTTCPDGTNSDNNASTCVGHF